MDDGSESSVEILRTQYSIDTAYEESREGISQLSHLTPSNGKSKQSLEEIMVSLIVYVDQSSSLFSIPANYEFEITSTQRCLYLYMHIVYVCCSVSHSKLMSQPVPLGNLSPIMDLPELDDLDMDVG